MSSYEDRPSISSLVIFAMIVLSILYLLSFGPVIALVDAGHIQNGSPWLVVYVPLTLLCHSSELVQSSVLSP